MGLNLDSNNKNIQPLHKLKAPPRIVIAIDLPSLPNEGERLIKKYESGIFKLTLPLIKAMKKQRQNKNLNTVTDV